MKSRMLLAFLFALLVAGALFTAYVLRRPGVCTTCGPADVPETMTVQIYFSNTLLDPEVTCVAVFPVLRTVPKTSAPARAALEALLAGPTDAERAEGYFTSLPEGVRIQRLSVEEGTAAADFDETLERSVGGSCRVAAIRAQITKTLERFPTVRSVAISIDGRTEGILEP